MSEIQIFRCFRCQHEWPSKREHPRICPKCKSAYWDTPRKGAIAETLKAIGDIKLSDGSGLTVRDVIKTREELEADYGKNPN